MSIELGKPAPPFTLPSGQGPQVGIEEFRGKRSVIVWFTKGMACPFCRHQMSRLARGYAEFRQRNAEVLEVSQTQPEKAKAYLRAFPVPFPYLCDADFSVHRAWGLDERPRSVARKVKAFIDGARAPALPPNEYGKSLPWFREIGTVLADSDMGFFIVDPAGVVRYTLTGNYTDRQVPPNDEILEQLARC